MRPIDLEEQKQIQLNILIKVDQFCRERNLRYSLGGGTLLGAVRHKGFIPWDDDIDIMMPRPDYDQFVHSFNGYDEDLTCEAYELNKSHIYPFGKVYHNKTLLKEIEVTKDTGIYIDIFPIDGFPENKEEQKKFIKDLYLWRMMLYIKHLKFNGTFKRFIHKIILYFIPTSFLQKKIQQLMKKYSFSNAYCGAVSGIYQEKECYPHSVFEDYIQTLSFEGHHFLTIKEYDSYLKQHYGDYMQLPPKEKQIPNHTSEAHWIN